MLVLLSGCCIAEEGENAPVVLKAYENDGAYQYIELGYYPFTSTGSEQPILWRVLNVHGDMALLRSEYAIDIFEGNKYSDIDSILGDVCENSLGTLLERGAVTTGSIPSVFDLNSPYYGYAREGINEGRKVEATPYTAANGILMEEGYAAYWTYDGKKICYVTPNGGIIPVSRTMSLGIVPIITASVSELRLNEGSGTKQDPFRSTYSQRNMWFEHNMEIHFYDDERYINNPYRKRIDVYTGPGEDYYLPEGASINKHETRVKVLAREGSWLMIEYMISGSDRASRTNCYKTGWIYATEALKKQHKWMYNERYWDKYPVSYDADVLPYKAVDAYVSIDTMMYDDRNLKSQPLYVLEEGRSVKLLGYMEHNDILLGYVEANIYDQKARGFVMLECLEAEEYDIGFMTVK